MLDNLQTEQVAVGGGLVAAIAYKIWQIVKSDRRQDNADKVADEFRDDLMKELTELRVELKLAHSEQVASARREAELSAEVKILSKQVESLIKQVDDLQELLEECKKKMSDSCDNCKYKTH